MVEVTRDEFEELHAFVLDIHSTLSALNRSLVEHNEINLKNIAARSSAEKIQDDWILKWHAQVTAHTNALCAIASSSALLLIEAGVDRSSILQSFENAHLALDLDMRSSARPIFDAVLDAIRTGTTS